MDSVESHEAGAMDISEHQRTWARFVGFIKWSSVFIAITMVLLAIFRTHG